MKLPQGLKLSKILGSQAPRVYLFIKFKFQISKPGSKQSYANICLVFIV